jgi:hypothetical protein
MDKKYETIHFLEVLISKIGQQNLVTINTKKDRGDFARAFQKSK